jgi:hypothetical protein
VIAIFFVSQVQKESTGCGGTRATGYRIQKSTKKEYMQRTLKGQRDLVLSRERAKSE